MGFNSAFKGLKFNRYSYRNVSPKVHFLSACKLKCIMWGLHDGGWLRSGMSFETSHHVVW